MAAPAAAPVALGLVATSLDAREAGHQRPLMDLLLEHRADRDFRNGGPLVGAVYYGEVEAARFLIENGARCDLISAAGAGRVDLMAAFVVDGQLRSDAHTLTQYSLVRKLGSEPSVHLGGGPCPGAGSRGTQRPDRCRSMAHRSGG